MISIANSLRYSFSAQRPPRELLLNHLADKEMLLLLDNFEQMQPASVFLGRNVAKGARREVARDIEDTAWGGSRMAFRCCRFALPLGRQE